MDFTFSEIEEALRRDIRDFVKKEIPEDWTGEDELGDEHWPFTQSIARKLAEKKWLTMAWPKEFGGLGAPVLQQAVYREEMTYHQVPGVDMGTGGVSWVGPTLILFGTEKQQKQYLPRIASGETFWCTGYSEPGAGSDLAALQCRAVAQGDDYVINGQKTWTSSGHRAHYILLAARTDPNAPKHKGISLFLVDMKAPGVTVRPLINIAGFHHFNEVFFDNVRIPKDSRVGEENRGWYILAVALDFERSGIGYSANARRVLEELAQYARETPEGQPALASDARARYQLAELMLETKVSRLLSYRVASMQSQGKIPNYEASISKLYGTELLQRVANAGLQILGLYGQLEPGSQWTPLRGTLVKMYLQSVSSTIAAGTSEIMRNIIAQRGLGLPR